MNVKTLLFLILIILFIVGIATYIIQDHIKPKETLTKEFDFYVVTGSNAGFNLDRDKLHFGKVSSGSSAERKFTLTNTHSYKERIKFMVAYDSMYIEKSSNIQDWVWFYPSSAILEPNQTVDFRVVANPGPTNSSPDYYEGVIVIQAYKAWPWEKYQSTVLPEKLSPPLQKIFDGRLI